MTNEQARKLFKIQGDILHVRYMTDFLTKEVQVTPITKGIIPGTYRCTQHIIERENRLLENLCFIQNYLHKLCDECEDLIMDEDKRRTSQ